MFALNGIYRPITAQPFENNDIYIEIQPCDALKPYICCFWGTPKSLSGTLMPEDRRRLVIPDTCMDIILDIDTDHNKLGGIFSGINDLSFRTQPQSIPSTASCFAVRFYFWAVHLFADDSMKNALNAFADVDAYFTGLRRDFERILLESPLIHDRVANAERYLLKKLNPSRQNNHVMNAIYKLLKTKGTVDIPELAGYAGIGPRQLERLFAGYVGLSPKKLSGLVRYQSLWQDIVYSDHFDVQDEVCKYGYTDQAHLLNDFKKYHGMTTRDARLLAYGTR